MTSSPELPEAGVPTADELVQGNLPLVGHLVREVLAWLDTYLGKT